MAYAGAWHRREPKSPRIDVIDAALLLIPHTES